MKILLFGTGSCCENLKSKLNYNKVEIIGYIDNDKNKQGKNYFDKKVISVENIKYFDFDYIVIASQYVTEIKEQLHKYGVDEHKIIPYFIHYDYLEDINKKLNLILNDEIKKIATDDIILNRKRRINIDVDYVRQSSLELITEEIYNNNIKGNVAELGVYRGDFAKKINELFYDRKLYLFDTFEGFDNKDAVEDVNNGFTTNEMLDKVGFFKNTNTKLVLSKMKYPQNCIIKKGYFPKTAEDVDDAFSFVSIDADLFAPIYEGLKYFYKRLSIGGYIFVHDYNLEDTKGAKKAVKMFCKENNITYFPLTDIYGTAVISK